jgi:RNA polymerase sigma-70 factor (ECF subfamily)
LLRIQPSHLVYLNRAVAIGLRDGPANPYLAHSTCADMYRRLGWTAEARASYEKALALTQQEPKRQFPQERIQQLK